MLVQRGRCNYSQLKNPRTVEIVGPHYWFSADTALAQEILDLVQQASHYRESASFSEWSLPYGMAVMFSLGLALRDAHLSMEWKS